MSLSVWPCYYIIIYFAQNSILAPGGDRKAITGAARFVKG